MLIRRLFACLHLHLHSVCWRTRGLAADPKVVLMFFFSPFFGDCKNHKPFIAHFLRALFILLNSFLFLHSPASLHYGRKSFLSLSRHFWLCSISAEMIHPHSGSGITCDPNRRLSTLPTISLFNTGSKINTEPLNEMWKRQDRFTPVK